MKSNNLERRLSKNQAFWDHKPLDHPLMGVAVNITFPMLSFEQQFADRLVTPDMIRPEDFFADWDVAQKETEARGEDLFMVASPLASVPWMEAIAGCPVRSVPGSGSMWAEPLEPVDLDPKHIRFDPNNAWLRKLVEFSNRLREHAAGRYPIGNPILRGVSDMVAAILGATPMVYNFIDQPAFVHELCDRCTEIWHGVAEELTKAKSVFHGGSCADRRRVWGTGTSLLYQDDAVALTSPAIFQEFFLPRTAEILRPYDNTMIHLHSQTLPIVQQNLCDLSELKAIEVLLDPSGPDGISLLDNFCEILSNKSLVICGEMTSGLIQTFISELPATGLCLEPKVDTSTEGDLLWQGMRKMATPTATTMDSRHSGLLQG